MCVGVPVRPWTVTLIRFVCCFPDENDTSALWPQTKVEMESVAYGTLAVGLGFNFALQSSSLLLLLIIVFLVLFLIFLLLLIYKRQISNENQENRR